MWFFWSHKHWEKQIKHLQNQVSHLNHEMHHLKDGVRELEVKLSELQHNWGHVKAEIIQLAKRVEKLETLPARIAELEEEISTGLTKNPELHAYLLHKVGSEVRLDTAASSLQGVVLAVADDAVEIREPGGDLLIIPFSKITSVQ